MKETFLPPGVQRQLHELLGTSPRQLPARDNKAVEQLWHRRNTVPDNELAEIDAAMLRVACAAHTVAAALVGRRRVITRDEMAAILIACARA